MTDYPYAGLARMESALDAARAAQDRLDPLAALGQLSVVKTALMDAAADLCILASQAGATNKRIALMLDVPVSALRGLRDEARSA